MSKTVGQHWNSIVWIPRVCWIAKWTRISSQLAYNTIPSKHYTQPNAGLPLVHRRWLWPSTIQYCWRRCVHRVQADTDPMSVKCWAIVAGAEDISGSMVGWCSIDYTSTMLWTKAGLMLAPRVWHTRPPPREINTWLMLGQRRRRWANISPPLCQRRVFEWMGHCLTDRDTQTGWAVRGKPTCLHLYRGET